MGTYTVKNSCGIKCKKENKPQVVYTVSKADQGATGITGAQGSAGLTDQEIKKKIIEARKNAADSDRKMQEALRQHQSQQANSDKKKRDAYNAEAKRQEGLLGKNKNSQRNSQSTQSIQRAKWTNQLKQDIASIQKFGDLKKAYSKARQQAIRVLEELNLVKIKRHCYIMKNILVNIQILITILYCNRSDP